MIYFLAIAFLLSLSINIFLAWYIRNLIRDLGFISSNIVYLKQDVKDFIIQLNNFLAIETYSDEPVIKNLHQHTKELIETIEGFDEALIFSEKDFEDDAE